METSRVRMVERAGPSIGSLIHNKVFWSKEACGRPHCRPCKTKAGSCRPVNVTYRVRCSECLKKGIKAHYVGETHRSLLDRALEHEAAVRSNAEGNAMAKHAIEFHPEMEEEKPVFTYEVISSYKSSLARQLREALLIEREECTTIMNTKGEWGINLVPRLVTEDNSSFLKQKPEEKSSTSAKRPPPDSREVSHLKISLRRERKGRNWQLKL